MTTTTDTELEHEAELAGEPPAVELELDGLERGAVAGDTEPPAPGVRVLVCDRLTDAGEVCGATFSAADHPGHRDPERAAMGKYAAHIRFEHPADGSTPKSVRDREKQDARNARTRERRAAEREARGDARPSTSRPSSAAVKRADVYAQSIATYALMVHLGLRAFDDFDVTVMTKQAPALGGALAGVAEVQPAVRQIADAILGGGVAGPYVALIMAAAMTAAPIAAHHGLLPPELGTRFGEMIGVAFIAASSSSSSSSSESPPAPSVFDAGEPAEAPANGFAAPSSADDVMSYLSAAPPHVLVDLQSRLMGAENAIPVPGEPLAS